MIIVVVYYQGLLGIAFQESEVSGAPGLVVVCIGSYLAVLVLSFLMWVEFHRVPFLKRALLGCALGYYAPVIWTVMSAMLWFILVFLVLPVTLTLYLLVYLNKAERVVPTGLG
jgi:hypothetical protein